MKKCCKFHDRLDLKHNDPEYGDGEPVCGLAGSGSDRDYTYCCKNCPLRKFRVGIRLPKEKNEN